MPKDGLPRQIIGLGFPAAAGTDQRTLIGTATWVLTEPQHFDIDVAGALPTQPREWGGFSGAALFTDNLLVGVVRTYDPNWQGKLEATPATALLDDPTFQTYCRTAGLALPIRLDAGPTDTIMRLDFQQDQETTGLLRFSPRNPNVPFIGRETELQALQHFLFADDGRPFSWWLMTGGGGTGKTRLARQLCLLARRQGWRAGFLPRDAQLAVEALDAWSPRTPVLIVADYVMPRLDTLRRLVNRLELRQGLPRLRLLLLEREAGALFDSQFLGSDTEIKATIIRSRHQPEPLALLGLSDNQLWSIVKSRAWRTDNANLPPLPTDFFQRLEQLDGGRAGQIAIQHRPLVAMMLADALSNQGERAVLTGLEPVLRDIVDRDRKDFWPEQLGTKGSPPPPVGTTDADVAIAFATMADGLGLPELASIQDARGTPIDKAKLKFCGVAIGKPLPPGVPVLDRLEPDLIGEFFALETLIADPTDSFAEPPNPWMPQTAWRARGSAMFDFVARAKQTFPQHPAIPKVDITVSGVKESWYLAALAIVTRAIDLTEGLDKARVWLLPHAETDHGAALAFADLTVEATLLETGIVSADALLALLDGLKTLQHTHTSALPLKVPLAQSMINTGLTLGALGRGEEEIAIYDDLLARFATAPELALRELVAKALRNKGLTLGALGRGEEEIAIYDDLLARFATAPELALRELVANALFNKGLTLGALDRNEEEIAIYDDLLARFATALELPLREQVAKALLNTGVRLGALGRGEEEIAIYDDLLARFATAPELALRELVAKALRNKGLTLGALGRGEEEIAIYDDLLARFATAPELALREQVAKALRNKGLTLGALGRGEEEIAVYDDLLARFATAPELALRELVANALFHKGLTLGALGRGEEEIAIYDDLLARFATALELPLREQVAKALLNTGVRLGALGRGEEEIAIYDDLLARFATAPELPLREQVAKALRNKGLTLGALGRGEEEIAVYDDLLARFATAPELALRELVANALFHKGLTLGALGRGEEEIAIYDDLLARFATAPELALRELVAKALRNKGLTLGALGRGEEEIAIYDDLLARFATAPELPLREQVANALFNKGVRLGALGRGEEEIAIYDDLLARFATALELPLREQVAKALLNTGVRLGALGRGEEEIAIYDDLLARFATAPELALRELVAKALRNKGLTLGALGRGEEEIAVYDDLLARFATAPELALREQVAKALLNTGGQARCAGPRRGRNRRLRRSAGSLRHRPGAGVARTGRQRAVQQGAHARRAQPQRGSHRRL